MKLNFKLQLKLPAYKYFIIDFFVFRAIQFFDKCIYDSLEFYE